MSLPGGELLAWIVSIGGAVTVLGIGGRKVVRGFARLGQFLSDWEGTEERPGVPARPGVMARLRGIEIRLDGVEIEVRKSNPPPVTINMPQSHNHQHKEES